jgi:hypothetical protein
MERQPIEEHFGEGFAKPIRLAKRVGSFCLRLFNPYYPPIEDTSRARLHRFFEEARAEQEAHDFDLGDDLFMRHYTAGQGEFHLKAQQEIEGITDGLEL